MSDQQAIISNAKLPRWLSWRVAFIIGLAFLIYLPALRAGFIWDDEAYVTTNPTLKNLAGLWDIWFRPLKVPQYYPLTFSSLWINYQLGGLNPLGYHAVNILLQALNALLLWRLLERLKIPGAWFTALLFLVHPVNVESVAWITERKNVLSGLFYFLAFLSYLRCQGTKPFSIRGYILSFSFFLMALMSKTVTGTLPVAILLALWWKEGKFPRNDLIRMAPFFVMAALFIPITTTFENSHLVTMGIERWTFSFPERVLIAGRALWFYLGKLVWPYNLTFIYPRWVIDAHVLEQWFYPLSFAGLGAVLWQLRPNFGKGPFLAWLFFTITLFPALGFKSFFPMRYSFVADHFQYLAAIAPLALGTAAGLKTLKKHPRIRTAIGIAILFVFGLLSWKQCFIYKDLETLWRDTLAKNPGSWMAHNNLAALLISDGRDQEAVFHLKESLRLNPDNEAVYTNFGNMAARRNDFPAAVVHYRRALELLPTSSGTHNNLGIALFESGKTSEAIQHFFKAIEYNPEYALARSSLGNVALKKGDLQNALRWYREAIALDPDFADAYANLGRVLFEQGQMNDAIEHYEKALKLEPGLASIHLELAKALTAKDLTGKAEDHIQEAVRLEPKNVKFRTHYATFLEKAGKTPEAIEQYNEILRLDPQNTEAQNSLRRLAFVDFQPLSFEEKKHDTRASYLM